MSLAAILEQYGGLDDLEHWVALCPLSDADLARRALAGDATARHVATYSNTYRWREITGDYEDDPPLAVLQADARKRRRRAILRGRRC